MKINDLFAVLSLKHKFYVMKVRTGASSRVAISVHCQLLQGLLWFSL